MSSHPSTGRTGPAEAAGGTSDERSDEAPGGPEPSPSGNGHPERPPTDAPQDSRAGSRANGTRPDGSSPDGSSPDASPPGDAQPDGGSDGTPADGAGGQGVPEDAFRAAMTRLAAGVVLVTAHDAEDGPDGAPAGMTATAFLSVSLRPPLVLVSVRTGSRMDEILERQPLWAASLLADSQRAVAGRFAMKGRLSDRLVFGQTPHTLGAITGAPLLDDTLAAVECRTEQRVPAGDHTLVVARVLGTTLAPDDRAPLTYHRGAYRTLG